MAIRDTITVERRAVIENKVNAIPGMATSECGILISLVTIQNWETSRGLLPDILQFLCYQELNEATTIVELALWKVKRQLVRVEFPGPAKDAVLQFLLTIDQIEVFHRQFR